MWYLLAVLVVIVLLVAACVVGVPSFLQWLASENLLFTTVQEGTVKTIMRGDSFDHHIMSFKGYHLNDPRKDWHEPILKNEKGEKVEDKDGQEVRLPDWEVVYHGEGNKKGFEKHDDDPYDDRLKFLKNLGLYWVGLPWAMSVYIYDFEWNETYTDKNGEEKIFPRAEPTDFIYVSDFLYAIKTVGAETKDRLPTDVLTLVTIAVRNPYRALFSGEDWMRRITAAINRHMKTFVGNHVYQMLISPSDEKTGTSCDDVAKSCRVVEDYWRKQFSEPIIKLTDELPDDKKSVSGKELVRPSGLKGRYGVEIRTADLQTMDLSSDGKRLNQEAATRVYVAKQDAEAITLKGQAEADVIEMKGLTEAKALTARLKVIAGNEAGQLLAQLDAMQEASKGAGNTVIWANNPFVPKGGEKS